MLPMLFGVVIGIMLPVQTAMNSRLRGALHSLFAASFVSFGLGTVALLATLVVSGAGVGLPDGFLRSQPWWIWIGGALGVVFLTGNIALFSHLGAVQTVVMPILGQIVGGEVIDQFGLFDSPVRVLTYGRGAGTMLAIAGVVLVVAGPELATRRVRGGRGSGDGREVHGEDSGREPALWLWRLAGIAAGMLSAMQSAVNGTLGAHLHSAVKAAFISFLIGTLALVALLALQRLIRRVGHRPQPHGSRMGATRWWFWIGGLLGAFFVYGNATLVPVLGTGLTVVVVIAGQLLGGLGIDRYGLLGASRRRVHAIQLIGIVVLIAGGIALRLL
ncbi:MAG: DMT family transporter [Bifidobacterium sp.]|jgi:transporter family-2 protein|nr:DMT family transporter [Bifidobacterium sp.]MCI1864581.1 DMT family transporter [Bifidobacterium sp.]